MKRLAIFLIKLYQKMPFSSHFKCKYIPTCSNYSIEAINRYGFIKGSYLSIKRILRCNPLSKGGFDPVCCEGEKNEKKEKYIYQEKPILKSLTTKNNLLLSVLQEISIGLEF